MFPPVLGVRMLFGLGVPGGLFIASRIAQTQGLEHNWFLVLFCVALSISAFVFMPGTITVTKQGLIEKRWFGRYLQSVGLR